MTTESKPMPEKIIAYFDGFQVCITECEPTEHDVFPHAEYIRADRAEPVNRQMLHVLTELYAQVKGECPSLLNEDSGGDAELDMQIQDVITAAEQCQQDTVAIPRYVLEKVLGLIERNNDYIPITSEDSQVRCFALNDISLLLKPYVKGGCDE